MKKIRQIYLFLFFSIFSLGIFSSVDSASAILCTSAPARAGDPPGCQQMNTRQECQVFCSRLGRPCAADESAPSCEQYLAGQRVNAQNRQEANDRAQEQAIDQAIADSKAASQAKKDAAAKEKILKEQEKKLDSDLRKNPLDSRAEKIAELNQLKGNSIQDVIGIAIKTAMGVMGSIALIMFIYGGFLWMTAAGNSSQIDKAQNVIIYAALGIMIIFGSYALVTFIFESVNPANTDVSLLIKTYLSFLS